MVMNNKFKVSNLAICLKAIKDFVDIDEAKITKEEQIQIKAKAKMAMDHLPSLYCADTKNIDIDGCPSRGELPTILKL